MERNWEGLLWQVSKAVEYGKKTFDALKDVARNRRLSPEETNELQGRYEEFCVENC